jgi:hypothetical protein
VLTGRRRELEQHDIPAQKRRDPGADRIRAEIASSERVSARGQRNDLASWWLGHGIGGLVVAKDCSTDCSERFRLRHLRLDAFRIKTAHFRLSGCLGDSTDCIQSFCLLRHDPLVEEVNLLESSVVEPKNTPERNWVIAPATAEM